jgi:hypothetical protein
MQFCHRHRRQLRLLRILAGPRCVKSLRRPVRVGRTNGRSRARRCTRPGGRRGR